jgi:hypothetical protein
MYPEDRLDALLTALRRTEWGQRRGGAEPSAWRGQPDGNDRPHEQVGDDELAPLLESARRLSPLHAAQPDPVFVRALEARVLVRAAERRREGLALPREAVSLQREQPGVSQRFSALWSGPLRPLLVAAALILALGMGTLTVAAAAGPGSPLFGLHRLEQSVQVGVAGDSAEQARQHLQLAQEWLVAAGDAAAQHLGDPTYSDALAALRDEDAAAEREIAQVPPGAARTTLEADLATLRADERTTLQAALPSIGWPDRIATTTALGTLGVAVPRVTNAILYAGDDRWHVTLTGGGFEAGAVLLVNGQPAGRVTATSDGLLTAELAMGGFAQAPATLGVGNPDGAAAVTDDVQVLRPGSTATPGEHEGTPEPGDRATPTSGSSGSGQATPTLTGSGSPTPDH